MSRALSSVTVTRRLGAQFLGLDGVEKRLRAGLRPLARRMWNSMRIATGGASDHFTRQAELLTSGGATPWLQSQRARREGNLTLVDTGAYRRAWLGQGPGSTQEATRSSFAVGVNPQAFPQVVVFQAEGPTAIRTARTVFTVAPRPIAVSKGMVERGEGLVLDYLLTGQT